MLSDFENVTGPVSVPPVHLLAKRWQKKQFSREKENDANGSNTGSCVD